MPIRALVDLPYSVSTSSCFLIVLSMSSTPCINLLKGSPATARLPTQRLSDAAVSALSKLEVTVTGLDYGPDEGHFPLRTHLAEWLTGYYKPSQLIKADRICVTGGASQNLSNILQVFTDPSQTRYIWMPQASYHLGFRIFEDAGFYRRLRAVSEDEEGMDMEFLERALAKDGAVAERAEGYKHPESYRKIFKHVIYCVPNFSNPTGITISLRRREALVRLARKFNALVICDDVYDFLHWPATHCSDNGNSWGSILPRVVDLDRTLDGGPRDSFGNVIKLPQPLTARNVTERALREENLMVGNGDLFVVPGDQFSTYQDQRLRLCFVWENERELAEGVSRLEKVLVRMLNEEKS
ncbi:uncharacterized protein CDV56_100840 [Aspergillus thermomutatus]|uniref:Aminotransferase class I/classII large domain-containing protein n=1 Tax=Aspergillus thermomutatus TaxID=41047 RepID=A0A397FZ63_ASPTH|nr:uncharacterized protein CDV56_100840 [Aspergillus thermomutatus]RHZ43099.1 hypothetical protein CDV56_100840 [Aspergillus thermomutatus]